MPGKSPPLSHTPANVGCFKFLLPTNTIIDDIIPDCIAHQPRAICTWLGPANKLFFWSGPDATDTNAEGHHRFCGVDKIIIALAVTALYLAQFNIGAVGYICQQVSLDLPWNSSCCLVSLAVNCVPVGTCTILERCNKNLTYYCCCRPLHRHGSTYH
jgi:hypothetical protein